MQRSKDSRQLESEDLAIIEIAMATTRKLEADVARGRHLTANITDDCQNRSC